jgi:FixJ family two-component response regulator
MAAVIHVIDDDASLRKALARLLIASGYEVHHYACAGDYLITAPDDSPGCLLLDLNLPGRSGLALQESFKWHPAHARPVVFLTGCGDVPTSVQAMKAGACDFLTKPVDRDTLLAAVALALERDAATRDGEVRRLAAQRQYAALTGRERVILQGVVAGKLNKQIAYELGVTERTVKGDRAHAFRQLGVHSLSELMPLVADLADEQSVRSEGKKACPRP